MDQIDFWVCRAASTDFGVGGDMSPHRAKGGGGTQEGGNKGPMGEISV